MQIICISRGSYHRGKDLAEKLATRLDYQCISREDLMDEATKYGIPVGKIELAMLKKRPLSENMIIEVDRFKSFVSATLCERSLKRGIVYHGRTGHLVLPGMNHIMRVRAIYNMEARISLAMNRLNLTREQAKSYAAQVDEDRHRWVRLLYNETLEDPSLYDVTVNLDNLSIENTASFLMQMAALPEFEPTPASQQELQNLLLASRCRLVIGKDSRTSSLRVKVKASKGTVSVTYLPRQEQAAEMIPKVLENVPGITSLICTVATTNILFIQEKFDPKADSLDDLISIAEKWNASIELVRLVDGEGTLPPSVDLPASAVEPTYNGGILDDDPTSAEIAKEDEGVTETINRLVQVGRAGGTLTIHGDTQALVKSPDLTENNSLIVVGDLFLSKDASIRKRLTRDLISLLSDKVRVPVVGTESLKARYLFGRKQLVQMILYGVLAVLIYILLFSYQEEILNFVRATGTHRKLLVAVVVAAIIPLVASIVGGFYHNVLKLIKLE